MGHSKIELASQPVDPGRCSALERSSCPGDQGRNHTVPSGAPSRDHGNMAWLSVRAGSASIHIKNNFANQICLDMHHPEDLQTLQGATRHCLSISSFCRFSGQCMSVSNCNIAAYFGIWPISLTIYAEPYVFLHFSIMTAFWLTGQIHISGPPHESFTSARTHETTSR